MENNPGPLTTEANPKEKGQERELRFSTNKKCVRSDRQSNTLGHVLSPYINISVEGCYALVYLAAIISFSNRLWAQLGELASLSEKKSA